MPSDVPPTPKATPTREDEERAKAMLRELGVEGSDGRVHAAKYWLAEARAQEREAFIERLSAWRDLMLREGGLRGVSMKTEAEVADMMIRWVRARGAPEQMASPKAVSASDCEVDGCAERAEPSSMRCSSHREGSDG